MPQLFLADVFIFQCGIILLVLGSIALFVFLLPNTLSLGAKENNRKNGTCRPRNIVHGPGDRLTEDNLVANDFQNSNASDMKFTGHGSVRRAASRWQCIGHGHRSKKPPWQLHDSTTSDAGWIQTFPSPPHRTQTSRVSLNFGMTSLVKQCKPNARWRYSPNTAKPQNTYDDMQRGSRRHRTWNERERPRLSESTFTRETDLDEQIHSSLLPLYSEGFPPSAVEVGTYSGSRSLMRFDQRKQLPSYFTTAWDKVCAPSSPASGNHSRIVSYAHRPTFAKLASERKTPDVKHIEADGCCRMVQRGDDCSSRRASRLAATDKDIHRRKRIHENASAERIRCPSPRKRCLGRAINSVTKSDRTSVSSTPTDASSVPLKADGDPVNDQGRVPGIGIHDSSSASNNDFLQQRLSHSSTMENDTINYVNQNISTNAKNHPAEDTPRPLVKTYKRGPLRRISSAAKEIVQLLRGKRDASLSPPSQLRAWCRRKASHASTDQCASGIASFLAAEQPGQTQQFDQYLATLHDIQDILNPGLHNYIEVFLLLEGMTEKKLKLFPIPTWLCVLFCYTQGCVEEEVLYKVLKKLKLDAHILRRATVCFVSSEQKMDLAVKNVERALANLTSVVLRRSARLRSGRQTTEKDSSTEEAVGDPYLGSSWQPLLNELGCDTGHVDHKISRAACPPRSGKQVYTSTCATPEIRRGSRGDISDCSATHEKVISNCPTVVGVSTSKSCSPLQHVNKCMTVKLIKEEVNPYPDLSYTRKVKMESGFCDSAQFPSKKRRTQALRCKTEEHELIQCKHEDPAEGSSASAAVGTDGGIAWGKISNSPDKRADAHSKPKDAEMLPHGKKQQSQYNTRRTTVVTGVNEEGKA